MLAIIVDKLGPMDEKHNPNKTEDTESSNTVNRRSFVKALSAASGAAVFGTSSVGNAFATETESSSLERNIAREEVSVSETDVKMVLEHKESKIALKEASFGSLNEDEAVGHEIKVTANGITRAFHEVVIPSTGGEATFSYVTSDDANNVASIKTKTGTVIRATARDNEIQTEILEFGKDVINEGLQMLEQSGKKTEIEKANVTTLHSDRSAASFDKVSGTTYLYIPATMKTGEQALVYAEIPASGNPDTVHVMQQDYWACVSGCVLLHSGAIGSWCWSIACSACAAGLLPSCAACLACAGGVVGFCGTVVCG